MTITDGGDPAKSAEEPPSPGHEKPEATQSSDPAPAESSGGGWLRRAIRSMLGRRNGESFRDAIEELVEEAASTGQGPEEGSERALIVNVLRLHEITVEDVMVPRPDIVAIDIATPVDEIVAKIRREAHSRMPVYRETLDDLVGFIHIKDLLAAWGQSGAFDLEPIIRDALFVPPSMRVLELLAEMRQTRTHIAIVVDEFGGVDGLVTIEDLVEQIVGEIQDEHEETDEPEFERRPDGSVVADGRVLIDDFEQQVAPFVTEEQRQEYDTLGGLVFALADRVPTRGDVLRHESGVRFEVLEADPRRVRRLRVSNLPTPGQNG